MKKAFLAVLCSLTFILSACESSVVSITQSDSIGGFSSSDSSSTGVEESLHSDQDSNGYCDDCQEKVTVTFDVYSVNDLHGKLTDGDNHPGVDELSAYFKNAKAKNENTILLSAGDMWQGASESNLTRGNIITEWMNEMDFVSMTLGNHEYDWGEDAIENNAELAEFPFLALNVYDKATNQRVDYCDSSVDTRCISSIHCIEKSSDRRIAQSKDFFFTFLILFCLILSKSVHVDLKTLANIDNRTTNTPFVRMQNLRHGFTVNTQLRAVVFRKIIRATPRIFIIDNPHVPIFTNRQKVDGALKNNLFTRTTDNVCIRFLSGKINQELLFLVKSFSAQIREHGIG